MQSQILHPLADVWHHHLSQLEEALDESSRALQNLLRLDEYHRHGYEEPHLQKTLGPYGAANLNLASLSEVLSQSGASRGLSENRLNRINQLLADLGAHQSTCSQNPEDFPFADIEEAEAAIHEKAEAHLNRMAGIFRTLRMSQLEVHAKYQADVHDETFARFNWRRMSPAELQVCPPFVITADIGRESGPTLRKIMSLLESRKPLKIFALRSSLRKAYSPTADPSVPASLAVEMIPVAMRGVYFLQANQAAEDFGQRLFAALTSPRPALVSLLGKKEGEDEEAFRERMSRAMRVRAFPAMVYDPDAAPGFVSCFDLSGNPEPGKGFTFAHYAVEEPEFAEEFRDPDPESNPSDLVPFSQYMLLNRRQRVGKWPCIYLDPNNQRPQIASQAIVTQASDLMHLWKTLIEVSGVDNPYVKTTRASLEQEHGVQQQALIKSMQEEMEKTQTHREQVAVAAAVQRIVSHYTGVDSSEIDLKKLMAIQQSS